jgi:hypothetical protein
MKSDIGGPWVAIEGGPDAVVRCADGSRIIVGDLIYHPENRRKARLIAAAPDLLAACLAAQKEIASRRYVAGCVDDECSPEWRRLLRIEAALDVAISKAAGQ